MFQSGIPVYTLQADKEHKGTFWCFLARFGSFCSSLWVVLARFVARCGSLWVVVGRFGSFWVVLCFSVDGLSYANEFYNMLIVLHARICVSDPSIIAAKYKFVMNYY